MRCTRTVVAPTGLVACTLELTKGRDVHVSLALVRILMQNNEIVGIPGPRKVKRIKGTPASDDLVQRKFERSFLDELWVSDRTEHPTREGKDYCCCVLDTCSRRIVGWSIDSAKDTTFVVNALDMAIRQRRVKKGSIVHADHGTQGEFNRSLQHLQRGGINGKTIRVGEGVFGTRGVEVAGSAVA